MLLTEGQMSDYQGAALMFEVMPQAPVLLGDRGYDAKWFRQALVAPGTVACIPSRKNRKLDTSINSGSRGILTT